MDELRALVAALPPELARRAFTHSSWTEDRAESYERLEFLGDGVLGLAVAEELCRRVPRRGGGAAREAAGARRLASLVRASSRACSTSGPSFERERERRNAERAGLEHEPQRAGGAARGGDRRRVRRSTATTRTAAAVVDAFHERIAYASETLRRSQDGAAGTGGTSGALRKLRADGLHRPSAPPPLHDRRPRRRRRPRHRQRPLQEGVRAGCRA